MLFFYYLFIIIIIFISLFLFDFFLFFNYFFSYITVKSPCIENLQILYTSHLLPRLPHGITCMTFLFPISCYRHHPRGQTGGQNYALCPVIHNGKSYWCKDLNTKGPSFSLHGRDCKKVIAPHINPATPTLPRRWGRGYK